jgi:putative membrane protein
MVDGILGTRASLMLDVVFLAMFAVLPVLAWSVWLVKSRRNFVLHKRVQTALSVILLLTVALFEMDMRLNGWRSRASASPFFPDIVMPLLYVHLFFAVTTAALWSFVVIQAYRHFPQPPTPGSYSVRHRFWGWLAAIDMVLTALTGWTFYVLAFVC